MGGLLGREHASTPQSGVEAPRLLKTETPQIVKKGHSILKDKLLIKELTLAFFFFSLSFVCKICVFVSRPMKIPTFLMKNVYTPKRVVDFHLERDTFRNKTMEIVEDVDEKSYNNNGKPWKSSRILCVNPNFFIFFLFSSFFFIFFSFFIFFQFFLFFIFFIFSFFHFVSCFCHFLSFFSFFSIFSFFHFFHFFIFFHFLSSSFFFFDFLSSSFFFFDFLSFSSIFFHFSFSFIFHFLSFFFLFFIFAFSFSFICFHFLSFSSSFLSFSFIFFHFFIYIYFHFLFLCWVLKIRFFWASISLRFLLTVLM